MVDEAQGLPRKAIEELRMLSNFNMDGRSLLQSFLLGQREFRTTMRSEGFEQLRQLFQTMRARHGYDAEPVPFSSAAFDPPRADDASGQLRLF